MSDAATMGEVAVSYLETLAALNASPWVGSPRFEGLREAVPPGDTLLSRLDAAGARTALLSWALVAVGQSEPDFRTAGEIAARTVDAVRAVLERRGLLERVPLSLPVVWLEDGYAVKPPEWSRRTAEVVARLERLADEMGAAAAAEVIEPSGLLETGRLPSSETLTVLKKGELLDEAGALRMQAGGDLLVIDVLLAEVLDALEQADQAKRVRATKAGNRGVRWARKDNDPPQACQAVVQAVWVALKGERERARVSRPAVVRATLADVLLPVMSRQHTLPTLDDGKVLDGKRRELGRIALVSARMTHEGVRRGLELFGSVVGNRLLKSLVLRSHEQQERGDPFALRVRYAGGWAGLADALGFKDKNTAPLVHLADAGAAVVWATAYARGMALWALAVTRGNHLRPGEVAFTLNTPLAPGYAAELANEKNNSRPARMARRLVPELRYEPPTGAVRANEAGAVWTLHRRFLLELVDRAEEMVTQGGVALSSEDWRRFALEVGLPVATLPKVLDSWRAGESAAAPALLAELEPGLWTLADAHDLERRFLLEAGERRLKGREHGRKAKRGKLAD